MLVSLHSRIVFALFSSFFWIFWHWSGLTLTRTLLSTSAPMPCVTFKQYSMLMKTTTTKIGPFFLSICARAHTHTGGMPDIMYYTGRRYYSGIIGCISEIVLGGELKLSLDSETLGLAHNVEPGYF